MFALQRKVASRSNIGVFYGQSPKLLEIITLQKIMKNSIGSLGLIITWHQQIIPGVEGFYVHKSLNPDDTKGNYSASAIAIYNKNNWEFISDWVYVDSEFQADLGFVPRRDFLKVGHSARRYFIPKNRNVISRHNGFLLLINYWRPGFGL